MKRILLMIIRNFWRLPGAFIKLCKYSSHPEKYPEEERYKFLAYIVTIANKGGNVTVESYGAENIPKENGFMFFPNHQGMYDTLAIVDACSKPLSVVSKKEVANIPLLKQLFKVMQAIFIDREDVRQSMQVIVEVSKQVAAGRNYIIFPEGTRSKDGNNVGDFKGGSFKAATKAKCPIVPVALIDSFKPFDTKSIKQVNVQVHILEPMLYEEYKDLKTIEIAEIVRKRIVETIEKYKKDVDN